MADGLGRRIFQNGLLVLLSAGFSLAIAEIGARMVLDPVDYLLPSIVEDPYLNHRVASGSGGHDEWGFRNYERPERAEIVAIGDSMTYGMAAHADESWPAVLSELTGKTTYNVSLGGWGALHYLHLLREHALPLEPDQLVVGLYLGNDLLDVINLAYSNDNWADYRLAGLSKTVDAGGFIIDEAEQQEGRFLGGLRNYLARTSVMYRVFTKSPLLDRFRGVNTASTDERLFVFSTEDLTTILRPGHNKALMDLSDPQVPAAIEITKRTIREIREVSRSNDIDPYFLLIPSKELVYSEIIEEQGQLDGHADLRVAMDYEKSIRAEVEGFLASEGIAYIDPLAALRQAARDRVIYPFNDGHPNADGYRIIAGEIAAAISMKSADRS